MGEWHRENPDLVGTDADPWMQHDLHRQAYNELRRMGLVWRPEDDETEDDQ
jgi:hypothetical protein